MCSLLLTVPLLLLLSLLFLSAEVVALKLGVKSAVLISQAKFTTLNSTGYVNFIGQYYDGSKVSNPNSLSGIAAGLNTNGMKSIANADTVLTFSNRIDAYHVPAYTVSATLQYPGVSTTTTNIYCQARKPIDVLHTNSGANGRTYVVVSQSAGSKWSANQANNQAFMAEFLSYFPTSFGIEAGILSNQTDFQAIFGSSYTPHDSNGNPVELLLTSCNGNSDLNSPPFTAFNNGWSAANGWNTLQVKAYQCGVTNIGGVSGVNGDTVSHI